MKRIVTMHFSPNGGTKATVDGLAAGFTDVETLEVDLSLPANREKEWDFGAEDLVIVGMPVYSGRLPALSSEIFAKLAGNQARAVAIAAYGNRHYDDALLELNNELAAKGFRVIASGAVIAEHCLERKVAANRPDADDQAKFLKIAAQIESKLKACNDLQPSVPGNQPYKPLPAYTAPTSNASCDNCGLCAKSCPVEAIDFEDPKKTNSDKCIFCGACINTCPKGARATEKLPLTQKWLRDNCNERREMEWFL